MLKYFTLVILALSTQIIGVIMWGQYVWLYKRSNGGVGGTPLEQIHPMIWGVIFVEAILLIMLIAIDKDKRQRN